LTLQKVFMPVEDDDIFNVVSGVARHVRKLRRHPAETVYHAADGVFALRCSPLGKREF